MTIRDIARPEIMTANPDQSAGNLATVMKEEGVGSVVIERGGEPRGIVTDRDLTMAVLEPRRDPTATTAEDIMTERLAVARYDDGVFELTQEMRGSRVRRMPVVDEQGELEGMVTLDDLLVLLAQELDALSGVIEAESPPY